jgi:hypothetical protein
VRDDVKKSAQRVQRKLFDLVAAGEGAVPFQMKSFAQATSLLAAVVLANTWVHRGPLVSLPGLVKERTWPWKETDFTIPAGESMMTVNL